MKSAAPLSSACWRRSATGFFAPGEIGQVAVFLPSVLAAISVRRSVAPGFPVENHVLHRFQQIGRNLRVNSQLPRVDDAHVQPGGDGVVEEGRMHGFADGVVAPKTEAQVADAPAEIRAPGRVSLMMRQVSMKSTA